MKVVNAFCNPHTDRFNYSRFRKLAIAGLLVFAQTAGAIDAQGHRGARGLLPENTLPAFTRALNLGVNTLEMDLAVTRDGQVVVMHDLRLNPDLTRDPEGNWLDEEHAPTVNSLTLAKLRSYDVGRIRPGSRYAKRFSSQQAIDGVRVPTLAEVFQLASPHEYASVRFNIETKINPLKPSLTLAPEAFVAAIVSVVRENRMSGRVSIQSFDWRTLKQVSNLAPDITTVYLSAQQRWFDTIEAGKPGTSPWTAGRDIDNFNGDLPAMIKAAGGDIWSPFHGDVTAENIAQARSLGLQVVVWTVNDEPRMKELLDMGVDGIISDYPDRLMELLKNR